MTSELGLPWTGSATRISPATVFPPITRRGPAGSRRTISPLWTWAILYSTFLGGSNDTGDDVGNAIAVGTNGFIYVAGTTGSTDFPVSNGAFQTGFGGGFCDAFVTALNPNASGTASLFYSSYLGGV